VGSCSSMESKYRFQTGPKESTGKAVPKEYWDVRKSDPPKAQSLLGGKGFGTMKNDSGQWVISIQGEKVENTNPADQFNTVLKMAKKRAHVDAVLTVTAASDIFTQDIEDFVDSNPKQTNGIIVDVKPMEETRVSKMIDALTKSGKLGNAERFVGKDSNVWTEADIDKIESAKGKKAKPSLPESPTIDDQGQGNGKVSVEMANPLQLSIIRELLIKIDYPEDALLQDCEVSSLEKLTFDTAASIIQKLQA